MTVEAEDMKRIAEAAAKCGPGSVSPAAMRFASVATPETVLALLARVEKLEGALTKLADQVFGRQVGDCPDVYADYDALISLERETRAALGPSS